MKCPNCLGEWTPPQNVSLSKCPFCQTDILQTLNIKTEELSPEAILRNLLQEYGSELLQQEQRLCAMIADLFAHDKRTQKMLLFSVKEKVPQQVHALIDSNEIQTRLNAIKLHLKEEAFLNDETATLITTIWHNVFEEPDDSFEIVWQRGYCGFRNSKGEMITPFKYDDGSSFVKGLAWVMKDMKFGFINMKGEEIIPLKYKVEELSDFWHNSYYEPHLFSEDLINLELDGKYGYIDTNGIVAIPFIYDRAGIFHEGLASVGLKGGLYNHIRSGIIDKQGEMVIPFIYEFVNNYSEGLALVEHCGNYAYFDKRGNEIIPFQNEYDNYYSFNNDLAKVIKGNDRLIGFPHLNGFINRNGDEVIPVQYEKAGSFSEGLVSLKFQGKYGFFNNQGEEIIKATYDDAYDFNDGLAIVKSSEKWGFVNNNGFEIVPFKYENAWPFEKGLSKVKINEKYGFVNCKGNEVIPTVFQEAGDFVNGLSIVKYKNKYGFIDAQGEIIIPIKYDYADFFHKGLAYVRLDNKNFYIDKNDNCITESRIR